MERDAGRESSVLKVAFANREHIHTSNVLLQPKPFGYILFIILLRSICRHLTHFVPKQMLQTSGDVDVEWELHLFAGDEKTLVSDSPNFLSPLGGVMVVFTQGTATAKRDDGFEAGARGFASRGRRFRDRCFAVRKKGGVTKADFN